MKLLYNCTIGIACSIEIIKSDAPILLYNRNRMFYIEINKE